MSEAFRMTVIDGIRYRPEDTPREPDPEPVEGNAGTATEAGPETEEPKPKSRRGRKA